MVKKSLTIQKFNAVCLVMMPVRQTIYLVWLSGRKGADNECEVPVLHQLPLFCSGGSRRSAVFVLLLTCPVSPSLSAFSPHLLGHLWIWSSNTYLLLPEPTGLCLVTNFLHFFVVNTVYNCPEAFLARLSIWSVLVSPSVIPFLSSTLKCYGSILDIWFCFFFTVLLRCNWSIVMKHKLFYVFKV